MSSDLYDPRRGGTPFHIDSIELADGPFEPPRTNCFSVYLIEAGGGHFCADDARHPYSPDALLFFVPYQHIRFEPDASQGPLRAMAIEFHANFLCVETFHAETGCSGVLFNDPYSPPRVVLDGPTRDEVLGLIHRMQREQAEGQLAADEVTLSAMRILLVLAARLKTSAVDADVAGGNEHRHPLIIELRELIETHYRKLHAPADYAALLHVTPKTLGRVVREQLGRTPTDLIRARILTHAKWQLLHTLRPVKEIAAEVGYRDELYFSRLFKKATGYSPTFFREFETEIRGGSNLSMPSSEASIQSQAALLDN